MSGFRRKRCFLGIFAAVSVFLTVLLPVGSGAWAGPRRPVPETERAGDLLRVGAEGTRAALPETPDAVTAVHHIQYFDDQAEDPAPLQMHQLDVYYPQNHAHPTVLFFVHGGAFQQGDIYEPVDPGVEFPYDALGQTLSGYCNYTTVVVNYELSNPDDGAAVHPGHVEDVARAFAWVKANIRDYGGDPGDVFVFGQSAGGHLASLLSTNGAYLSREGCSKSDIRGTVTMSGLHDLYSLVQYPRNPYRLSTEEILMYKGMFAKAFGGWSKDKLYPASPYRYASSSQPQFSIMSTEKDMPGLPTDADQFWQKVKTYSGQSPTRVPLKWSDYSPETRAKALAMAQEDGFGEDVAGHYAEVISINQRDMCYEGHPEYANTVLGIYNFIESH